MSALRNTGKSRRRKPVKSHAPESVATGEKNEELSQLMPSSGADAAGSSEDENSSDSDGEIENLMTTALLENGKQKLDAGDLKAAEKLFKKCSTILASSTANRKDEHATLGAHKSLEAAQHLVIIYRRQERWTDMQRTLAQKVRLRKDLGEKDHEEYLGDLIALARVSQRLDDLVEAQLYARSGLKRSMKMHRIDATRAFLKLLVELCKTTDNVEDEENYTTMLTDLDLESNEHVVQIPANNSESSDSPSRVDSKVEREPTAASKGPDSSAPTFSVESDTPTSGEPASLAPNLLPDNTEAPRHNFLNIKFDSEISAWSLALDSVFGTGSTTNEEDHYPNTNDDHSREDETSPEPALQTHDADSSAPFEPEIEDDAASTSSSDSFASLETIGTVHVGTPTRLSHGRASLVGVETTKAQTEQDDPVDQLPSLAESKTSDPATEGDKQSQQTQPESALINDMQPHVTSGSLGYGELGHDELSGMTDLAIQSLTKLVNEVREPPNPVQKQAAFAPDHSRLTSLDREESPTDAPEGTGLNHVDSVKLLRKTPPTGLTRKNSWTQEDLDQENSLGAYKQVSLAPESVQRARASTLQPNSTDPSENNLVPQRSLAHRNGKRASGVSRSLTARPVLQQTPPKGTDPGAASAQPDSPTPSPTHEHESRSQRRAATAPVGTLSPPPAHTTRMSIDDWQEEEAARRLPMILTETTEEPIRKHSVAFSIEASPVFAPKTHSAYKPYRPALTPAIPIPPDPAADEPSTKLDGDSVSVIKRTLTSASKVSYASTMSKASSTGSDTTIKPDKEQGLHPVLSQPTRPPKLVLVGDPLCGKTAIARRFAYDNFVEGWGEIGAYNYDMAVTTDRPDQTIQIDFWDTAGQEEFFPLRQLAYDQPQCVLICFSIDSKDSFDNVAHAWTAEVHNFCRNVPTLLIGCKADLRRIQKAGRFYGTPNMEIVEREEGVKMASSIGAEKYLECSAKDNNGVVEVFEAAIQLGLARGTGKKKRKSLLNLFVR